MAFGLQKLDLDYLTRKIRLAGCGGLRKPLECKRISEDKEKLRFVGGCSAGQGNRQQC